MSALKKHLRNRLALRRYRLLSRLTVTIDWQVSAPAHLMSKKVLQVMQYAWLGEGRAKVNVQFVSPQISQALNREWRSKDKATNVLSFPFELPEGWEDKQQFLGDLVICLPVLEAEASEQGKTLSAHLAHLLVHGLLHLQGYDHETEAEAQEMESFEALILSQVGFSNPYADESAS
jgi:probable rRNA maturation factor